MGMAPSGNIFPGRVSIFEPVHGSAPNIAGKNQANPIASVLAAAMMLEHVGLPQEAIALRNAVRASVAAKQTTRDIGGSLGTCEAGQWIADRVAKQGITRS
jgi:3-isopropylmalate dehydrogenase